MLIIISLLITILLGFSIMNLISSDIRFAEKFGFSFLIGMGVITFLMFIFDIIGIKISLLSINLANVIIICVIHFRKIGNFKEILSKLPSLPTKGNFIKKFGNKIKTINLVYTLFLILILICLGGSVAKSLFWPSFAYDNITGYELLGKVIAAEGKINNSLFEVDSKPIMGSSKRTVYPPLVAGSFAYAYLNDLKTSKLISSLFLIFFTIGFYSLIRRSNNRTNSIFFTFLTIICPEMFAFTSLSSTNIPFAIYTSLGMIYLFYWLAKGERKDLILSAVMIFLSSWTRSEGIVFAFTAFLILTWQLIKRKNLKEFIIFNIFTFSSFIIWNLYVRMNFTVDQNVFFTHLFWDYDKIVKILAWINTLVFNTGLYGITFYAILIFIVLDIKNIIKLDNSFKLLVILLVSFGLYTFLFYQMDNSRQDPLHKMMKSSYRRGLFAFIPFIYFYLSNTKLLNSIFVKFENLLKTGQNEDV